MKKYILKAIKTFDEDITRNAATPAISNLFEIRQSPALTKAKADNFHSVTASLLFILRRCHLDIQTAVGFLTTRLSCPTEDDWTKLRGVLQYLRGTIDQSAIKIEKNGKRSSGQKTKHMDNRYFLIKDHLNTERITVEYCPTGKMTADFFTKPLQGNLFRKFRDLVLGYKHISEIEDDHPKSGESSPQECTVLEVMIQKE
jgi:hypothetical protein